MSVSESREMPGELDTPEDVIAAEARLQAPEDDDVFEDASDAGEVLVRRPAPRRNLFPAQPLVSPMPQMRPELYDGTGDWSEYLMYFEQLAELGGWDEGRMAGMLAVCLKGEARVVISSMEPAMRRSYAALTGALSQNFAPKELVHLHQAELKSRRKKADETMGELGRDIAKLVRQAFPMADSATRDVIGINSFLDALPGAASDMKLHVIKGRPRNLQEAVAHATEVDAVMEADNMRSSKKRGDVRMVGAPDAGDMREEVNRLIASL